MDVSVMMRLSSILACVRMCVSVCMRCRKKNVKSYIEATVATTRAALALSLSSRRRPIHRRNIAQRVRAPTRWRRVEHICILSTATSAIASPTSLGRRCT